MRICHNGNVYLRKSCPEHGDLEDVLIWRNSPRAYQEWTRNNPAPFFISESCPQDCGPCSSHKQKTCTAILEVTQRCNLQCPVCFAACDGEAQPDPDIDSLARTLEEVKIKAGLCPLQISGGEPTLRDDLPQIVALAHSMGFDPIQINTNGIRLAQEEAYGRALVKAGASVVYLQFDGLAPAVYQRIRGTDLLPFKLQTIRNSAQWGVGVILVPTLIRGVNDNQVGDIIQFAKDWVPTVRGVHFQPITYLGRYPQSPKNEDRFLLSDLLDAIERQTQGEIKVDNLLPSCCEAAHCSFSALSVLGEDGTLMPTTRNDACTDCSANAAERAQRYVRRHWKHPAPPDTTAGSPSDGIIGAGTFFDRIRSHTLSLSGMAFQDAWNIDLERLQQCCVHVAAPGGRLIPLCLFYLTDSHGRRFLWNDI